MEEQIKDKELIEKVEAEFDENDYWLDRRDDNEDCFDYRSHLERVLVRYARWIERAKLADSLIVLIRRVAYRDSNAALVLSKQLKTTIDSWQVIDGGK